MRHGIKTKKLNRTSSHRKALMSNMAVSLVLHEQITTTVAKAKVIRPVLEKLVTTAKKPGLSARRSLLSVLRSDLAVNKLLDVLGARYKDRNGGYLRIMKAGFRYGDMAPMAVIEFVDRDVAAKGKNYGEVVKQTSSDKKTAA